MVICPRQGAVGTFAAYCQLFIQPSMTGRLPRGRLLKVSAQ